MTFEPFQPAKPKEEGAKRGRPSKQTVAVVTTDHGLVGTTEELAIVPIKKPRKPRTTRSGSLPVAEMLKVIEILDPLKHPQKVVVLKKLLQMFEP